MKRKFLFGAVCLLMVLSLVGFILAKKTTATNRNFVQLPSQVQSVRVTSFETVDASVVNKNARKIIFSLQNDSDKDVYLVDLTFSKTKTDKNGVSFFTRNEHSLPAHGKTSIDYVLISDQPFTPELNAVVFQDGSYEGDRYLAERVAVKRAQNTDVVNRYKDKITAIDKAENPLDAIGSVRQALIAELAHYGEDDHVGKSEPMDHAFHRTALLNVLSEIDELEKVALAGHYEKGLGAGISRRISAAL